MISILLLPFMCLSMTQEGAKAEGKPFSVNEITSPVNYISSGDDQNIDLAALFEIHNEGTGIHNSRKNAEELATVGAKDYNLGIRGTTTTSNKNDVYSFHVVDRTLVNFRFTMRGANIEGKVQDERGKELFEFKYGSESDNPTALLKKGIYFVVLINNDGTDASYIVSMSAKPAPSSETITIDADMMSKYKALVWESDYVPGGADPIDGTVVKTAMRSRRSPWSYTGGFYSCKTDEEFLARSIYIWSNDVFELLRKDIKNYRETALKILEENGNKQSIAAIFENISSGTGAISGFFCKFVPIVGKQIGTALKAISFATSIPSFIIGNSVKLVNTEVDFQCGRVLGALDGAKDGKIISLKQNAVIRYYENDSQYIKRHTWKLRYIPHLNEENKTYSVVERSVGDDYPTYDMKLHHGSEKEIVSDCQGTFKAYTSIKDINFTFVKEG